MRKDLKNLYIVGASGFGKEVQWLIKRINKENKTWNLLGYIDDGIKKEQRLMVCRFWVIVSTF